MESTAHSTDDAQEIASPEQIQQKGYQRVDFENDDNNKCISPYQIDTRKSYIYIMYIESIRLTKPLYVSILDAACVDANILISIRLSVIFRWRPKNTFAD